MKCNLTAQQENSISYARHIKQYVILNERRMYVMIDSEVTNNFIEQKFVSVKRLNIRLKRNSYDLMIIDDNTLLSENERVTRETTSLTLMIDEHTEKIFFDIVEMITHSIVLKIFWLRYHNSIIDWIEEVLKFAKCNCVIITQFTHRQSSMMNEMQSQRTIAKREIVVSMKNTQEKKFDSSDIDTDQSDHKDKVLIEEIHASSEILESIDTMQKSSKNVSNVYKKWTNLFREEKSTKILFKHKSWDHEIKLISEKHSTFEFIYALSEKKLSVLRNYLNENLKKEFIKRFESSTEYSILFASKKNDTLRLCVDYKKLNDITIKNRYSLLNISELQNRLSNVKIFTKINLKWIYNLIRMKKKEEWKTVFRIRYELYEYTIMSFEFTNVSTSCQELINNALREHLDIFVIAYLNDILIYSKNLEEHIQHVKKMLNCLDQYDLKVRSEKCSWHKKEIDFLEFIVRRNEIRMNSNKVKAVDEWKKSTNVKKVQAFLEFVNYNRKFIEQYFKKTLSLINLTIKNKKWKWNKKAKNAFQKLKRICINKSVLKMFDSSKSIRIETNASDLAIDACLSQEYEDKWHSMTYYSRKLSSAEQNYDIHDKKLLVIIASLEQWRIYAERSSKLTIYTNHKNLLHFIIIKQLNRRQMRWSKLLEQYKFTIQYTSEKENERADVLSRRNDHMKKKNLTNRSIFKINKNDSLSASAQKMNATLKILKDQKEQYFIEKERLIIFEKKINETIKKYHDESLQEHLEISKILQLLRQHCRFSNMRRCVETYIKRCFSCQRNKHSIHKKYEEIQY